jgi:hypothetical protein
VVAGSGKSRLTELAEEKDVVANIQEEEAIITVVLQDDFKKINNRSIAEIKAQAEGLVQNIAQAEISLTAPASSTRFRGGGGGGGAGMKISAASLG